MEGFGQAIPLLGARVVDGVIGRAGGRRHHRLVGVGWHDQAVERVNHGRHHRIGPAVNLAESAQRSVGNHRFIAQVEFLQSQNQIVVTKHVIQVPFQVGFRFSRKAAMPSFWSSLAKVS